MGWNADGTCSRAGGGFNANRSSVAGGVFGTDDAPPSRRQRNVGFSLDQVEQAEQRDTQHLAQMQRQQQMAMQQRQQQMAMQQRQQQMAQQQMAQQQMAQQQMAQQQMAQQQHRQQMAQQQQQQAMMQQRQQPMAAPPSEHDSIKAKNQSSSFGFADCWDESAQSFRGGKARKGVTNKNGGGHLGHGSSPPDKGMAAGGFKATGNDRFGGGGGGSGQRPGSQGSTISLGSACWDGSSASPRSRGSTVPGRGSTPVPAMRSGGGGYGGYGGYEPPAAGGGQRPDQRAHLGSNVCFG